MIFYRIGIALIIGLACLAPLPAMACFMQAPQHITDARVADIALIGRVVDYLPPDASQRRKGAVIAIRTVLPLRGVWHLDQKFIWLNSTFALPKEWRGSDVVFIAATETPHNRLPLRGPSGVVFGADDAEYPVVLQAPCSSPFIFRAWSARSLAASLVVLSTNWVALLIVLLLVLRAILSWKRSRRSAD